MASTNTNSTQVTLEVNGSRAIITFDTDGGLNVLTTDALRKFGAIVSRLRTEPKIRTTTIRASGKVFMAGSDINEIARFNGDAAKDYAALGQAIMADLAALPSITVAAIHGAVLGAGLELVLACDFRIAVKSAKLGLPEVSLGLVPPWGGINRLNKLIGSSRAKRLLLDPTSVTAEDAHKWGLVDDIVNSLEDLRTRLPKFCESFYRASPGAVASVKKATRDFDDTGAFLDCFGGREAREGMAAFIEKRPAKWME
jgi:enoyl-CoA hydratase